MDFLFMPLEFVKIMLRHLYELERDESSKTSSLKSLLDNLYQCSVASYSCIANTLHRHQTTTTTPSCCSIMDATSQTTTVASFSSSSIIYNVQKKWTPSSHAATTTNNANGIDLIPVKVRNEDFVGGEWFDGNLIVNEAGNCRIRYTIDRVEVDFGRMETLKRSKNGK